MPDRYVIYAFNPETRTGGLLNDQGKQVPTLNEANWFSTMEAAYLVREHGGPYDLTILQILNL